MKRYFLFAATVLLVTLSAFAIEQNVVADGEQEPLKVEDVGVGFFSKGGDVRLEYKMTLK